MQITPEMASAAVRRLDGPLASDDGMLIENALMLWEELIEKHERLKKQVRHLSEKPIGVFGEEFGWEFHYKSLKDDLRRLVKTEEETQGNK